MDAYGVEEGELKALAIFPKNRRREPSFYLLAPCVAWRALFYTRNSMCHDQLNQRLTASN